jgi:hypothetical protein
VIYSGRAIIFFPALRHAGRSFGFGLLLDQMRARIRGDGDTPMLYVFSSCHDFIRTEAGPARAPVAVRRPRTLYERDPLQFWQGVAALLALALILSLLWH